MSDNVQITLIIVIGIALFVFKDKINLFEFKANKKSVNAKMKADKKFNFSDNVLYGVDSDNVLYGVDNEINTNIENVSIERNRQIGKGNKININESNKKK